MIKNKRKNLFRGERTLRLLITLLIIGNVFGGSLSMAFISKTNFEVESIKEKISKQENINASLEMKINELASLDNVEAVATTYGLGYNNSNIRRVSSEE